MEILVFSSTLWNMKPLETDDVKKWNELVGL